MEQQALLQLLSQTYQWIAYAHSVGEGETLAQLLIHMDNAVDGLHLGPKHRATLEAALARWPPNLSLQLCDALGMAALLHCRVPLDQDMSLLRLDTFCPELKRIERGQTLVLPTDDLLIEMHSLLHTQSQKIAPPLRQLVHEHDQHQAHLERMQRRLARLEGKITPQYVDG